MKLVLWQLILVSVEYVRPVEKLLILPDLSSLGQCLQLLGRRHWGKDGLSSGDGQGSLALIRVSLRFLGRRCPYTILALVSSLVPELLPKIGQYLEIICAKGGFAGLYVVIKYRVI